MRNILLLGAFLIVVLTMILFVMDGKQSEDAGAAQKKMIPVTQPEIVGEKRQDPVSEEAIVPEVDRGERSRIAPVDVPEPVPLSKLKVANFTGKLEKVDVGCFADGECYVEVDGKHITAIMGWSQETVGQVQGVDGFGDLESHIGESVEVYAQDTGDGTYTLYGNEGFYIKLK